MDVARLARALEALGDEDALKNYIKGHNLEGDERPRVDEMLGKLTDKVRGNIEASRRDLRRHGAR